MFTGEKAPQKALNLQAVENYLNVEITPAQLADVIDEIIFDFVYCYGLCDETSIAPSRFSTHVFYLSELRDLFLFTAISNGKNLETNRMKNKFEAKKYTSEP